MPLDEFEETEDVEEIEPLSPGMVSDTMREILNRYSPMPDMENEIAPVTIGAATPITPTTPNIPSLHDDTEDTFDSFSFRQRIAMNNRVFLGAENTHYFTSGDGDTSLDKPVLIRLMKAKNALQSKSQERASRMIQLRGRREGQYIKMLRSDKRKNMTYIEIIGSEIPLAFGELPHGKIRNIFDSIRMNEVSKAEVGGHKITCFNPSCKLKEIPYEYAYFCDNHIYCAEHVPDNNLCTMCYGLQPKCKLVKTYDGKQIHVCSECLSESRHTECRTGCGTTVPLEYIEARLCPKCIERTPRGGPLHSFSKSLKWTTKEIGEIVKSTRIFSSEIEALSPMVDHAHVLYGALPGEVGIATDGSVTSNNGRAYGFELQTPRLAGARGEELVQRVCTAVKQVGASVNESCGMHVHIDGQGLIPLSRREYPAALIQMWKAYLVFEDVLMSLVPYSRRNNDFCRRLSEAFQINELDTIETVVDAEKLWYKARTTQDIRNAKETHYSPTRYFAVNFHCLLNDGHFEIRFHPGTTNAKKVLEWANLHVLIADAAVRLSFTPDFLRDAQATYNIAEKTDLLFSLIGMTKQSKEWFASRQRTFASKKRRDEETKNGAESHRGNSLMIEEN